MAGWTTNSWQTGRGVLSLAAMTDRVGPPILCLHGVTRLGRDWSPVVGGLASRYQLHLLDFHGHGDSEPIAGRARVIDYVADAVSAIQQVIEEPVIIMGHSLGAMVALRVAVQLPGEVLGLVLEDPPYDTMGARIAETPFLSQFLEFQRILTESPTTDARELARRLASVMITDPRTSQTYRLGDVRDKASLRFHAGCLSRLDPEALRPIIAGQWLHGLHWQQDAERVECPALLLQADADKGGALWDENAEILEASIQDLSRVCFPGIGHGIHASAPEAFLRVVVPFLESLGLEGWRTV